MPTENTGSLNHGTVTVGTSATLICAARQGRGGAVTVQNVAAATDVFIGGPGVTTANGLRATQAGGVVSFDAFSGAVYGIVASGTADVRFAETY